MTCLKGLSDICTVLVFVFAGWSGEGGWGQVGTREEEMPFKNMKTCGQGGTGEGPRPEPQKDCVLCSAHNQHEVLAFPSALR